MTNPSEHERVNAELRRSYRANRFSVDARGRVLGPDDETAPETEVSEDAEPERLGRADAGAQGAIPADPVAVINDAIRESARRRGA